MLSRFSDVLQSAADVLAPPASRLEDLEYHWKMVVNFYQAYDESSKLHIEDTRVPHHLHQMLQLIVEEQTEQADGCVGPCLEAVVRRRVALLDALAALARADRPAGARSAALALAAALLRRTKQPCLHSAHVYRPLQRMLVQCNESPASPTEKEEVELLLTLCGLVRKEPGLANLFTTPYADERAGLSSVPEDIQRLFPVRGKARAPKRNPLFDVEPPRARVALVRLGRDDEDEDEAGSGRSHKTVYDDNDKFLLIDLLLTYLNSADNQVVLRACEGIMIVCSLPEDDIANLVTSSPACERVVEQLLRKYRAVPPDLDPGDVDQLNITWAYVSPEFCEQSAARFPGRRQLTAFFSWLDYCDTLMKECHPIIAAHLARVFRSHFLEAAAEALGGAERGGAERGSPRAALLATALLAKCLRVVDSPDLINEFSNWLVGEGHLAEWPLLLALIDNCLTDDHDLTLETLRFFEVIIEKGTEHSMDRLVLSRVCARAHCAPPAASPAPLQDERDRLNDLSFARERERNSFLLLLPRAVLSEPGGADCAHYVHDAQRHYQLWLDITSSYSWRVGSNGGDTVPDNTASSTHSYDSRPEADMHLHARLDPDHGDADRLVEQPLDGRNEPDTSNIITQQPFINKSINHTYTPNNTRRQSLDERHDNHYLRATNRRLSHVDRRDTTIDADYQRGSPAPTRTTDDDTLDSPQAEFRKSGNCRFTQKLVIHSRDDPESFQEEFDEGPFLRMLFKLLSTMPDQPYQVNLHLTSIISKLALIPHPDLHEYLLEPCLPTAAATRTLFKTLRAVAGRLSADIPRIKNFRAVIESTRLQLMSEDPAYDEIGEHNQLVESLIVLEEFCKELAAIAFVKHQHQYLAAQR
ncbi:FHF complex subunit HOOK interacting protein 2A-like isoform X2 [Maniola jurtina]|uniref:FHF complex subunit HOOK interacting protein 2A-like isoform X2 n=1 Tax=Maniola jurtina TaxID=191418 RepID=UPI001E68DE4D|nr:FHF complex subunit HOOK interacting protein 2A-like isoform X2 [Maniola jurtina]